MRASLKWLEELVDVDVPVEKLAEVLSFSGTKVETVRRVGKDIHGVVVAEVLEILEHPNADNLTLVDVAIGDGRTERVVCGARNFAVGDRVPYAGVGSRLPDMEITERKIRGQVSRGMLCSGAELGVSKDQSGILVLPSDSPVGEEVVDLLALDDVVFDLEITPNRPDCLGMIGIAREVAALLNNELKVPAVELATSRDVQSQVQVEIDDPQGCPRYVARYIEGVKVKGSPSWMAARLMLLGIRPISNIVDITNYVLLETGHPLHAFDAAKVHEHKIIVRRARDRERLRTLDGEDRALHSEDLLIADPKKALAIAGVMGGEGSEVSDETEDVILESAYFDPPSIAFTSRRHLLFSEASARFERGADPEVPSYAAARAAQLMVQHAGGTVAAEEVDARGVTIERPRITLRPERTSKVLGIEVSDQRQVEFLSSIGFKVTASDGVIEVEPPSFRPDLKREIDLIEEVARLHGFQALPSTLPPGRTGGLESHQRAERQIRAALAGFGLHEAWTRSFSNDRELDEIGLPADHPARRMVRVANPTTEREAALRTTLIPGLLRSAAHNFAHRAPGVALFEIARVYEPREGEQLAREALLLGAVVAGTRREPAWGAPEERWGFFGAKGVLESLFGALRVSWPDFASVSGMPFHPTRAATVTLADATLGVIGEIHPEICKRLDVPEATTVFEIALAPVLAALPGRVEVEELPKFPGIYLDLAVVVDEEVAAHDVESAIDAAGRPELVSVRLFDLYRGEQVSEGKKSLAFALELRDPNKTLTDDEADAVRARITTTLESQFKATLRS